MFGLEPLCNHNPSHGLFIGNFCLPLCARCTAILLFAIIGIPIFLKIKKVDIHFLILIYFFGICCIADAFLQTFTNYESQNNTRFLTGAFLGLMIVHFSKIVSITISNLINKIIKRVN